MKRIQLLVLAVVAMTMTTVRPALGARDPLGYVDGMGLYEYARSQPGLLKDPAGTCTIRSNPGIWTGGALDGERWFQGRKAVPYTGAIAMNYDAHNIVMMAFVFAALALLSGCAVNRMYDPLAEMLYIGMSRDDARAVLEVEPDSFGGFVGSLRGGVEIVSSPLFPSHEISLSTATDYDGVLRVQSWRLIKIR